MARPLRIEYSGALYHVYSRGIAQQDIFADERDRGLFLHAIGTAVERHHLLLHAYCMMSNHYHFLLETPEGNLSRAMRHINGIYTQAYNRIHQRAGPLMQGRFKASLVEKDAYLLELSRYIVLNPVRAHLISEPEAWLWSSYRAMIGIVPQPKWLTTEWLLGVMGGRTKGEARKRYRAFVIEGMEEKASPETNPWGRLVIGGEAFIKTVRERISGKSGLEEVPKRQRFIGRPKLEQLFDNLKNKAERDKRIRQAFVRHGYRLNEIASAVGLHYTSVSHIVNDDSKENGK
jgi:REP element-mobilizing transposase RayT